MPLAENPGACRAGEGEGESCKKALAMAPVTQQGEAVAGVLPDHRKLEIVGYHRPWGADRKSGEFFGTRVRKGSAVALTECRECGEVIAEQAPTCPHCGTRFPGQKVGCVKIVRLTVRARKDFPIVVAVNGVEVAELIEKQSVSVEAPAGVTVVRVRGGGATKNFRLEVDAGETVALMTYFTPSLWLERAPGPRNLPKPRRKPKAYRAVEKVLEQHPVVFTCVSCNISYEVDEDLADTVIRCKNCHDFGRVPPVEFVEIEREVIEKVEPKSTMALFFCMLCQDNYEEGKERIGRKQECRRCGERSEVVEIVRSLRPRPYAVEKSGDLTLAILGVIVMVGVVMFTLFTLFACLLSR